jgi:hypothetical protein
VQLTGVDNLLWALSFLGHWILLAVLLVRRRAGSYPAFTALIAFSIARTIALFFTLRLGSPKSYYDTYWTLAIADAGLQLAIAYELASKVFRPLGRWVPDLRRSFLPLSAGGLAIAGAITWLAAPPATRVWTGIVVRGDFFASALMSEIFVAMVALSVTLGLPWKTHVARLAQGLGVYSIYGIFTGAARSYFASGATPFSYALVSRMRIVLYLGCIAYWSVTLASKEPEPKKMPEQLHDELRRLQSRAALVLKSLRTLGSAS